MKTTPQHNQSKSLRILNAYQKQPSIGLRNQLVLLNSGLVRQIAYRLSYQCNEPYEDLEQIGYIGLIDSIRNKVVLSVPLPYLILEEKFYTF
jgi:RNA polymerase sigma-B factor